MFIDLYRSVTYMLYPSFTLLAKINVHYKQNNLFSMIKLNI